MKEKRYRFSYQTVVSYFRSVSHHHFLLRCFPHNCGCQKVLEQQFYMLDSTSIHQSKDIFGNSIQYGTMMDKHDLFVVALSGIVDCQKYIIEDQKPSYLFVVPTKLTQVNKKMITFGLKVASLGSHLEQAQALASEIYGFLSYSTGATSTQTSAAECFDLERGVCQDYTHLLIALCRHRGIYARYVAGFVVGTGETHAWVEVYSNGAWYGIDPTHNLLVEYGYIKISHGRDASDCSVVRGMHRGEASHTTQVRVVVEEI